MKDGLRGGMERNVDRIDKGAVMTQKCRSDAIPERSVRLPMVESFPDRVTS